VKAFKSLAAGVVRKIGVFDLWQKGDITIMFCGPGSRWTRRLGMCL
jgi:hypothetical protein